TSVWTVDTTDALNNKLTFETGSGNAALNNSGGTNVIGAGVLLNTTVNVATSSRLDVTGQIDGSGGIVKSGTNTLYLGNANNTFSGPVAILEGSLQLTRGDALGGVTAIQLGDSSGSADSQLYLDTTNNSLPTIGSDTTIT